MEEAKKGKKKGKAKKGSKHKKSSLSTFYKILLVILIFAMFAGAILLTVSDSMKTPSQKAKVESPKAKVESQKTKVESQKVKTESPKAKVESQKTEQGADAKKTFKEKQNISGCWLSTEQGASLTIDDYGYRIDFFGVDASAPMTGMIIIEDNVINFISDGRDCKNEEGSYKISFDKKNIRLICKEDNCTKRKNILETEWEWLEY